MNNNALRVTKLASVLLQTVINPGDIVIDATAGTGQDTCFLAACSGETGRVFAFDIQKEALEQAHETLAKSGLSSHVTFVNKSHEYMADVLADQGILEQSVKAIVFNLGYFPGGDQAIITTRETTLKALAAALKLLAPNGMISVCLYPGHPGGQEETDAVIRWAEGLEKPFTAHHFRTLNRKAPPTLVIIQRMR